MTEIRSRRGLSCWAGEHGGWRSHGGLPTVDNCVPLADVQIGSVSDTLSIAHRESGGPRT